MGPTGPTGEGAGQHEQTVFVPHQPEKWPILYRAPPTHTDTAAQSSNLSTPGKQPSLTTYHGQCRSAQASLFDSKFYTFYIIIQNSNQKGIGI